MIYTDDNTIKTIKTRAAQRQAACDIALSLADCVKGVLEKYKGKSITGNKKRLQDAIKAENANLRCIIEWDEYRGVCVEIYYFDDTQGRYTDDTHFYLLRSSYSKDNILDDAIIQEIDKACRALENHKGRLQYTAAHIKKILTQYKKMCDELNKIHHDCDSELLEIARIKPNYYGF